MPNLDRLDQVFDEWAKECNREPLSRKEIAKRVGCHFYHIALIEQEALNKLKEQYCSKGDKNV